MAQTWRVPGRSPKPPRPPLDEAKLEGLALHYVGRYATTRAKLAAYLRRKLAARGWAGEREPPVEAIVARLADRSYVDDRAFAAARGASLARRGYGARRLDQALMAAGIAAEDGAEARAHAADSAWDSALVFARRRRIGPFAIEALDRPAREKALAAMIRAGHPFDIARKCIASPPGVIPEHDDD